MKVLLLGGTGAIGNYVTSKLNRAGNEIIVTSRKHHANKGYVRYIQGDSLDDEFLFNLIGTDRYDAIIDFMSYTTDHFRRRYNELLLATEQYVFLSSSRVYADNCMPLKEDCPRLLDETSDSEFLLSDEYALAKARQEDLLKKSEKNNYTIIRPYVSYSPDRLQLGVLEKEYWLRPVLLGLPVIFPEDMLNTTTTMTFGGDVAEGICAILGEKTALGEVFHITCNNTIKWKEVIELYKTVIKRERKINMNMIYVTREEFMYCHRGIYQQIYDRYYNRSFDNAKIGRFCNIELFKTPNDGLDKCLTEFLRGDVNTKPFLPRDIGLEMRLNEIARKYVIDDDITMLSDICGGYSDEFNVQVLIAMLKEYGIKKVIVSPGTTNVPFVGSLMYDKGFEIYSCVDERSAAYMACGMARESREPIVLSCTGATASRNYLPGLTEAYYSKLPIIAVTSRQYHGRIGRLFPQVIDRRITPSDVMLDKVELNEIHTGEDYRLAQLRLNEAFLKLEGENKGPIHIDLETAYSIGYTAKVLPKVHRIKRYIIGDTLPEIQKGKVAIIIGSHDVIGDKLTKMIETFCRMYNGVVICDHTSGYGGMYRVSYSLIGAQYVSEPEYPDLVISFGGVTGDYPRFSIRVNNIWRIGKDKSIPDEFGRMPDIFEMRVEDFFSKYTGNTHSDDENMSFYEHIHVRENEYRRRIPELPFSTPWIAKNCASNFTDDSYIQLGILSSLKFFNLFEIPGKHQIVSNVGGFGIDGGTSSLIGAALTNSAKKHFLITGDLGFFYDMNAIGYKNIPSNIRILLINNGLGMEMRIPANIAYQFGERGNDFFSAAGHFGNKSESLVKNYVENLGFKYIMAHDKEEFVTALKTFFSSKGSDVPILFEVFTDEISERKALAILQTLSARPL